MKSRICRGGNAILQHHGLENSNLKKASLVESFFFHVNLDSL